MSPYMRAYEAGIKLAQLEWRSKIANPEEGEIPDDYEFTDEEVGIPDGETFNDGYAFTDEEAGITDGETFNDGYTFTDEEAGIPEAATADIYSQARDFVSGIPSSIGNELFTNSGRRAAREMTNPTVRAIDLIRNQTNPLRAEAGRLQRQQQQQEEAQSTYDWRFMDEDEAQGAREVDEYIRSLNLPLVDEEDIPVSYTHLTLPTNREV